MPVVLDGAYTVPLSLAAELLDRDVESVARLVRLSNANARTGISGPLSVPDGDSNVTLASVLDYRRSLFSQSA
ncbi:hypothetical protein ACFQ6C_25920 [Streptomyces sp. NPDC056454]|uniref:hypothetical protein n=1 Tax=Streptomyces sp. NPDC056454 TaxID=3345823 RepID=UPI0036745AC0